jgi:hypothetical protein
MSKFVFKGVLAAVAGLLLFGCSQPPQEKQVSYKAEVGPILQQYCVECHKPGGKGTEKSGLDMSSYDSLMKGTKFGPVVNPGNSLTSALNMLVEGRADPSIKMPHGKESLPADKIEALKKWVQQGAKNN